MENFTAWNPTRLLFGKSCVQALAGHCMPYGDAVMIVYGKGSVKKNKAWDDVVQQLRKTNKKIVEFGGIKSNPLSSDVSKAVSVARSERVSLIVAVGGGSVIDSAKLIALCTPGNHDVWKVMKGATRPKEALPLMAVLTLAATGTEMNPFAVLQNTETREKIGFGSPLIYPKVSFLDPTYTLSVPQNYTAYGIADLVAHCLEAWFGEGDSPLSDRFVAAIIREAVEAGPLLLTKPDSYELRERIMWAATCALNGMTLHGRKSGDWGVHDIGHTLSFLYDIPHGASLTIAYPAWLRFHNRKLGKRIQLLGQEVFGTNGTKTTIEALEDFFLKIDCPVRLGDVKIPKRDREKIIELLRKNNVSGMYHKLNRSSLDKITDLMYSV